MATMYELANLLATLMVGRDPQWTEQTTYTGAPDTADDGVDLVNCPKTLVDVAMREEVHRRTVKVTIDTLDLTATYTIYINGITCAYDAGAGGATDEEDVIHGIRDAVNTAASAVVTAVAIDADGDGDDDTVVITGDAEAHYYVSEAATGTAVQAVVADPDQGTMRLYGKYRGTVTANTPAGWRMVLDQEFVLDYRGFMERFETAGLDRLYVELASVDGTSDGSTITYAPLVNVAPAVQEETSGS